MNVFGFGKKEEQEQQVKKEKTPIGDKTSEGGPDMLERATQMVKGKTKLASSSSGSVHAPDPSIARYTQATREAVSKFPFGSKAAPHPQAVRHKDDEIAGVSEAYIDKMGPGALTIALKEYKEAVGLVNEALSEPIPNIKEAHEMLDKFVTELAAKTGITKKKAEEIMASTKERIEGEKEKIPQYYAIQYGEKMIKGIDEESQEIFQNGLTLLSQSAKELRGKVIQDVRKALTPAMQEKQKLVADLQEKKKHDERQIEFYDKSLVIVGNRLKTMVEKGTKEDDPDYKEDLTNLGVIRRGREEQIEKLNKTIGDLQTAKDQLAQLVKMSLTLNTLADEK